MTRRARTDATPSRPPQVLWVGFDALDAEAVDEGIRAGALPTFARLAEEGRVLQTEAPEAFYVGGVWPSTICAVNPARHGQYTWKLFDPATYREEVPPYDDGEGVPLWRSLDEAGRRCGVVDIPRTIHVPLRHGIQVHDHGTHDPLAPGYRTWPEDLAEELVARHGPPFADLCDGWPREGVQDVRAMLERTARRIERKLALLDDVAARGPWDLLAVGFSDAHCVGHQLWGQRTPGDRHHDAALLAAVGDPVRRVHEQLDGALAHLLARHAGQRATYVLLSHGMGPHHDGSHLLDEVVRRIERRMPHGRAATWRDRLRRLRATDRTPRPGWRHPFRRYPRRRFERVFAVYSNEAWAGIRLNVVGREAHGRVEAHEAAAALEHVAEALRRLVNEGTGRPVFTRVARSRELHRGPYLDRFPDLVAAWDRTGPYDAITSPDIGRVAGRSRARRTGDHHPRGRLFALGCGRGRVDGPRSVMDLAPTIAAALGHVLEDVDGRVIEPMVPRAARASSA